MLAGGIILEGFLHPAFLRDESQLTVIASLYLANPYYLSINTPLRRGG